MLISSSRLIILDSLDQITFWHQDGSGDFLVCLNSDTEVFPLWDIGLCSYLFEFEEVIQTGYLGGLLEENGTGSFTNFGHNIDYVLGWCFCVSRSSYEQYGLFDEGYQFAYFEDADLSIKFLDQGLKIYSLYTPLVHHYGNKTINDVDIDLNGYIRFNQKRFREKNQEYLNNNLVKKYFPRIWGSPGIIRK